MKHTSKHNAGFTLVELVVAMAMATIVTAAATLVLLMGLRINRQTADTASQQITVRTLLNVMEDAAVEGKINNVVSDFPEGEEEKLGSWLVIGEDGHTVIFQYKAKEQTIYTNGIPVLEGVIASNAIMEGQLLSISIETKTGIYTSSIYCRTAEPVGGAVVPNFGIGSTFIEILKSQYRSRGEIVYTDDNPKQPGEFTYYSEWYISGYENDSRWNANTPWCACYVSWALVEAGVTGPVAEHLNWFANVDDFMDYFTTDKFGEHGQQWLPRGNNPAEGDLIFFDWDKGNNPEHVGVVLEVKNSGGATIIYTIEGNSAGRVTIRSYPINDPRIIGYGVLPWTT